MGHVISRTGFVGPNQDAPCESFSGYHHTPTGGFLRNWCIATPQFWPVHMKNNPPIGHVDTIATRTLGAKFAGFSRQRHGMVKDQKLWREIQLQYAKLRGRGRR